MHFFSGWLPDGMQILCVYTRMDWRGILVPAEMLGQIYQIQKITGERVSNVVVMGTGEPLDNYDNLLKFIHLLTDEHGLTYQPEKCDRIYLWNCAEDLKPCRGKSADHTGAISAWIHTGEEKAS